MTIPILFIVVFFGLLLAQVGITDYIRFYRSYNLPSLWFRLPPDPPQMPWLQQLWEAKKNN